jgi:hypothetical protein
MAEKRPYEDLETDYLEEENENGFLSLVSVVIAFIAVAVFIALAWYAYRSSTKSLSGEEIAVVYPEEGAVREAPEDAGGWQFPHQDKTVYNIVSGEENADAETKIEQILPAPEQPIKRNQSQTNTWMNDKAKQTEVIAKTDAERVKEAQQTEQQTENSATTEQEAPVATAAETVVAAAESTPKAEDKTQAEAAPAITPVVVKPVVVKPAPVAAVKPKPKPQAVKPKPVVAVKSAQPVIKAGVVSGGSGRIQLGAVRSEAEARAQWQRIRARFGVLGSKSLQVQAVQVAGKGTLYRIQATGFAGAGDAKAACGKLAAAGQACFVVK